MGCLGFFLSASHAANVGSVPFNLIFFIFFPSALQFKAYRLHRLSIFFFHANNNFVLFPSAS